MDENQIHLCIRAFDTIIGAESSDAISNKIGWGLGRITGLLSSSSSLKNEKRQLKVFQSSVFPRGTPPAK